MLVVRCIYCKEIVLRTEQSISFVSSTKFQSNGVFTPNAKHRVPHSLLLAGIVSYFCVIDVKIVARTEVSSNSRCLWISCSSWIFSFVSSPLYVIYSHKYLNSCLVWMQQRDFKFITIKTCCFCLLKSTQILPFNYSKTYFW